MKIISVASGKGGVGKSTLSVNLAASYGEEGLNVLVVDTDEQQTLVDVYQDAGLKFDVFASFPDNVKNYDVVIVDHHPSHEEMPLGEFVVVPIQPEMFDYNSYIRWKRNLIDKNYILVLSRFVKSDPMHCLMRRELKENEFIYSIAERRVYKNAAKKRRTVFEMGGAYKASEARNEINFLKGLINDKYS